MKNCGQFFNNGPGVGSEKTGVDLIQDASDGLGFFAELDREVSFELGDKLRYNVLLKSFEITQR